MSGYRVFYVNLPLDSSGRTHGAKAVIEVVRRQGANGLELDVIAPAEIAASLPCIRNLQDWVQTEGPARMLSNEAHAALTATL